MCELLLYDVCLYLHRVSFCDSHPTFNKTAKRLSATFDQCQTLSVRHCWHCQALSDTVRRRWHCQDIFYAVRHYHTLADTLSDIVNHCRTLCRCQTLSEVVDTHDVTSSDTGWHCQTLPITVRRSVAVIHCQKLLTLSVRCHTLSGTGCSDILRHCWHCQDTVRYCWYCPDAVQTLSDTVDTVRTLSDIANTVQMLSDIVRHWLTLCQPLSISQTLCHCQTFSDIVDTFKTLSDALPLSNTDRHCQADIVRHCQVFRNRIRLEVCRESCYVRTSAKL